MDDFLETTDGLVNKRFIVLLRRNGAEFEVHYQCGDAMQMATARPEAVRRLGREPEYYGP